MTLIVGNLEVTDEAMHPVDDHPQFNESALLTIFDNDHAQGGYVRIGNRANEGHAESTLCWFLPDGRALFRFERAPISDNSRFVAGGLTIEPADGDRRMHARFDGSAALLDSPHLLVNAREELKAARKVDVVLDLELEGLSPLYGGTPFPGMDVGGHYEQHMAITGTLSIDGETSDVTAWGNRDHSWGPRVWTGGGTAVDRTIWCTFDREFGFATSLTWRSRHDTTWETIGYVWRGDTMDRIVHGTVESTFEDPEELFHTSLSLDLHVESGSVVHVDGTVKALAPLRHSREGHTTHIGWAMAEFTCEGHRGLGLSEYLDGR
jgi:hypothetical protein